MFTWILGIVCLLLVARTTWVGWRKGGLSILVMLVSLGTAYLAAAGVFLLGIHVPGLPLPQLIQPLVFSAVTCIGVFIGLAVLGRRRLRRWDQDAQERAKAAGIANPELCVPSQAPWNRRLGLGLGLIQGLVLSTVLFVSVYYLGLWTIASDAPAATIRPNTRTPSVLSATGRATLRPAAGRLTAALRDPQPSRDPSPAIPVEPEDPTPLHGILRSVGKEVRGSFIGRAVDAVSPIKARQVELTGKLTQLAADEENLKRFSQNATVRRLMEHPRLVELARDKEIERALHEKRWADLMNDPRILAMARDESLLAEVRGLDLEALFAEVSAPPPPADGAPTPAGL